MSFFDLPEPQKYLDSRGHEQEDIAVYTWGEESYDGLGDALIEGGDELNDETFGGSGPVGKDFDFQQQLGLPLHRDLSQSGASQGASKHPNDGKETQGSEPSNISSLWDSKSMLSTMPRLRNQPRASVGPFVTTAPAGQTKMRTLAEIEEEMRANAQRYRGPPNPLGHHNGTTIERGDHMQQPDMPSPPQHFTPPLSAAHHNSYSALEYPTALQQQAIPPADYRDWPQSQESPLTALRTVNAARLPLSELHELSLLDQHRRPPSFASNHVRHSSDSIAPDSFPPHHIGYPTRGPGLGMEPDSQHPALLKQMAAQHTTHSNSDMRNYFHSIQRHQQVTEQHEQLKQRATRQIMEQEILEAKRRRKLIKISRMSRNNDLMTQSDKDFITRIQVSQLMMGDPYQEDFYNQVYQSLVRNRSGPGEHVHPKHGTRTGRRQNALQRMEAQVERIINNVRLREKEKDLHSVQHLQGALGKTSGRSYKAAPRQLLQVGSGDEHTGDEQAATSHNGLSHENSNSEGVTHHHTLSLDHPQTLDQVSPLSDKQILMLLERLYELVLQLEQMRREQPPVEDDQSFENWTLRRDKKMMELSTLFPISVPDGSSTFPLLTALLRPEKGKKLIQRLLRQLDKSQQLELLLMIINNYSQLDVVVYASALDNPVAGPDREELERQTEIFMHSVLSNFLPLIGELSLAPIIHIITLLLRRTNFVFVARSQPGIALLTALYSQAAHLKHLALTEGPESNAIISTQDLSRWDTVYDQVFGILSGHFTALFPSTRMAMILPREAENYLPPLIIIDALDQPIWNFLATFALHTSSDQQQIMVAILREKILDTVLSANQEWSAEGGARRIANVNLFLNALGLDASQIAF